MRKQYLAALPLAFAVSISYGTGRTQTQFEMNKQACEEYKRADVRLNRAYKQILEQYSGNAAFIERFKAAQRAWLAFRDAYLESLYPEEDKQRYYGTANSTCTCLVMKDLTNQRVKQLEQWTTGIPEGDICAGSRKTR
ncbi:MAG TPA: lysozyme inhibitor LprI family protein [Blastocatellia bacterium]|nr:lysozyme inhibitor LprI family protein [Blastocatellia bacterium]